MLDRSHFRGGPSQKKGGKNSGERNRKRKSLWKKGNSSYAVVPIQASDDCRETAVPTNVYKKDRVKGKTKRKKTCALMLEDGLGQLNPLRRGRHRYNRHVQILIEQEGENTC